MSRFSLIRDAEGYGLQDSYLAMKPLRIRFDTPDYLRRLASAGRKTELIARAVGAKPGLKVLDCTAGMGRDSFLLAYLGCEVTMIERSAVMATLLADGLERAIENPVLGPAAARVHLISADARDVLENGGFDSGVIYLDPMFPKKKGSAAVKGGMQAMQNFLGPDLDALALLEAAVSCTVARVVLKRPPVGDWQSPFKPVHIHKNRNASFEVYSATST